MTKKQITITIDNDDDDQNDDEDFDDQMFNKKTIMKRFHKSAVSKRTETNTEVQM